MKVLAIVHDAVFVLGGAMNADEKERHGWIAEEKALLRELLEREVPLLGLCLGGQLLAAAAGGGPRRAARPFGRACLGAPQIGGFNRLGRDLCRGWLAVSRPGSG